MGTGAATPASAGAAASRPCPGRTPLIAYTWLASALVPLGMYLALTAQPRTMAVTMVLHLWLPSFVLGNSMMAVLIGRVPCSMAQARTFLFLAGYVLFTHVVFIGAAIVRSRADEPGALAVASVPVLLVAYLAAMGVVMIATRDGHPEARRAS